MTDEQAWLGFGISIGLVAVGIVALLDGPRWLQLWRLRRRRNGRRGLLE